MPRIYDPRDRLDLVEGYWDIATMDLTPGHASDTFCDPFTADEEIIDAFVIVLATGDVTLELLKLDAVTEDIPVDAITWPVVLQFNGIAAKSIKVSCAAQAGKSLTILWRQKPLSNVRYPRRHAHL